MKKKLALLGRKLGHTFSPSYFKDKFEREEISGYHYDTLELETVDLLPQFLNQQSELIGLNVTIPYKQAVIPLLDGLDETASAVGAVNTIKRKGDQWWGYNTDVIGFRETLLDWIPDLDQKQALILGTGGASKAVAFVLDKLNIPYLLVSSSGKPNTISYFEITEDIIKKYTLIINTTPLGMYPNISEAPDLPYDHMSENHYLYDLIYNPTETTFMKNGLSYGAQVKNGYDMLVAQAEASWHIWTHPAV